MEIPRELLSGAVGPTTSLVLTSLLSVLTVVFVVVAVRRWITARDGVAAGCLIGGGLATLTEPFYDVMGGIFHYEHGVPILFTWADRGIPLHIGLAYVTYIGGSAYLTYRVLSAPGATRKHFLTCAAVSAVLNAVFEGLMTGVGLYAYYGDQPLQLWPHGFAFGWMANNIGSVLIGALLYAARGRLRGGRGLLALFVVPSGLVAWEFWCGWPMFAALNAGRGYALTYPGMLLTAAIAVVSTWVIADVLFPAGRSDMSEPATVGKERVA